MKLSTRARYGMRILVDLAKNEHRVSLGEITERQQVSRSYLQHLIAPLVRDGIIGSNRGAGGGIRLVQRPGSVKLSRVIKLLEGDSLLVDCVANPEVCPRSGRCLTREIWSLIEGTIFNVLDSITLEDLLDPGKERGPDSAPGESLSRERSTPCPGE